MFSIMCLWFVIFFPNYGHKKLNMTGKKHRLLKKIFLQVLCLKSKIRRKKNNIKMTD